MKAFFGIVSSKDLNLCWELCLEHKVEVLEDWTNFGCFFHEEHPSSSSVITNKKRKPSSPGNIIYPRWPLNIIVND